MYKISYYVKRDIWEYEERLLPDPIGEEPLHVSLPQDVFLDDVTLKRVTKY